MAKATTKSQLISDGTAQFEKLLALIDSMSAAAQTAEFNFGAELPGKEAHWGRDKNLRDVLVHLYEWHSLLLSWVEANQKGEQRPFLPDPYNWKTYGDMNVELWKKHQNTPCEEAKRLLKDSHEKALALAGRFSDEQLFTRGSFDWVGGSTLGQYFISATSGHYTWAIKKIKAHIKTYNS